MSSGPNQQRDATDDGNFLVAAAYIIITFGGCFYKEDESRGVIYSKAEQIGKVPIFGALSHPLMLAWLVVHVCEPIVMNIFNAGSSFISMVGEALSNVASKVLEGIGSVLKVIGNGFSALWSGVSKIGSAIWNAFVYVASVVWSGVSKVGSTVWNAFSYVASIIWSGISKVFSTIWNGFTYVASVIWSGVSKVGSVLWNGFTSVGSVIWSGFAKVCTTLWNGFTAIGSVVWSGVSKVGSVVWNGITTVLSVIWSGMSKVGQVIWSGLSKVGSTMWNGITSITSVIWSGLSKIGTTLWNGFSTLLDYATRGLAKVLEFVLIVFGYVWDLVKQIGNLVVKVISTIWNGIVFVATKIYNTWVSFIQTFIPPYPRWTGFTEYYEIQTISRVPFVGIIAIPMAALYIVAYLLQRYFAYSPQIRDFAFAAKLWIGSFLDNRAAYRSSVMTSIRNQQIQIRNHKFEMRDTDLGFATLPVPKWVLKPPEQRTPKLEFNKDTFLKNRMKLKRWIPVARTTEAIDFTLGIKIVQRAKDEGYNYVHPWYELVSNSQYIATRYPTPEEVAESFRAEEGTADLETKADKAAAALPVAEPVGLGKLFLFGKLPVSMLAQSLMELSIEDLQELRRRVRIVPRVLKSKNFASKKVRASDVELEIEEVLRECLFNNMHEKGIEMRDKLQCKHAEKGFGADDPIPLAMVVGEVCEWIDDGRVLPEAVTVDDPMENDQRDTSNVQTLGGQTSASEKKMEEERRVSAFGNQRSSFGGQGSGSVHRGSGSVHRDSGSVHRGSSHGSSGSVHRGSDSVHRGSGSSHGSSGSVHQDVGSVHRDSGSGSHVSESNKRDATSSIHVSPSDSRLSGNRTASITNESADGTASQSTGLVGFLLSLVPGNTHGTDHEMNETSNDAEEDTMTNEIIHQTERNSIDLERGESQTATDKLTPGSSHASALSQLEEEKENTPRSESVVGQEVTDEEVFTTDTEEEKQNV